MSMLTTADYRDIITPIYDLHLSLDLRFVCF